MGRSPLPHMTLPVYLNSQIAKISSCRLIPVKTFFLSVIFLVAFLLLPGINNFGWGRVQKYFFVAGFFIVPEFFFLHFCKNEFILHGLELFENLKLKNSGAIMRNILKFKGIYRNTNTVLLFVALILASGNVWSVNYYSAGNNAPNTTTNWWANTNGTGAHPGSFTVNGNVFIIQNGHTMTTTNTWTVSGTGSTIQINTGGTLVASNPVTATVMTVASGATYQHNYNSNSGTIPTATWDANSTCNIT
jgi:hypothetical protein